MNCRFLVAARDIADTAGLDGGIVERKPGGQRLGRVERIIKTVGMPGNKSRIVGLLCEERGTPAQNVGTDKVFHRIQQSGTADQIAQPGKR